MIIRTIQTKLLQLSSQYPIVTVTGPRQSGKTTLCQSTFKNKPYVNLESPDIREFARSDARGFLANYPNGAIIDEIQRVPELVSYLQPLVDEKKEAGQFILTGSQQFEIMSTISQSLAGRTALLKLLPLSISELKSAGTQLTIDDFLLTGFYPRIYDMGINPTQALGDYFETYVERDIRQLINVKNVALFEKFIRLCAGRVGQLLNLQSLGNDVGISHTTARHWLTLLEASYIVFQLQPWHKNISKRQIKSPKLYFYDVGLVSYLLGAENTKHIAHHPLKGNLFENMIVLEALKYRFNRGKRNNLYFWRDAKGNEIDILVENGSDVVPIEIKSGATLHNDFFKGLKVFKKQLGHLDNAALLVYGGNENQMRSEAAVWQATEIEAMMNSIYS